jgi:hypothetical protein
MAEQRGPTARWGARVCLQDAAPMHPLTLECSTYRTASGVCLELHSSVTFAWCDSVSLLIRQSGTRAGVALMSNVCRCSKI